MEGWLVYTRREGQSIVINSDIEVRISRIGSQKVSVSIRAPKEVPVHRKEVLDRQADAADAAAAAN